VADKAGNLDPDKLGVTRREAVAVHWLHHSLYDVTGSDSNTLGLIKRYRTTTTLLRHALLPSSSLPLPSCRLSTLHFLHQCDIVRTTDSSYDRHQWWYLLLHCFGLSSEVVKRLQIWAAKSLSLLLAF
jgi:hypothetical protein